MQEFIFKCFQCGNCCQEDHNHIDSIGFKRIPLYPEEAVRLENLAKEKGIILHLIEDIVFPDLKNSKIMVLTYRIMLDNENKTCPFIKNGEYCIINDSKPQACLAYPLSVKNIDAFNMQIDIDPLCSFTISNSAHLEKINSSNIKNLYPSEYTHAIDMLKRNKKAIFKLLTLEKEDQILIPKEIEKSDYNKYLLEWDRQELDTSDDF